MELNEPEVIEVRSGQELAFQEGVVRSGVGKHPFGCSGDEHHIELAALGLMDGADRHPSSCRAVRWKERRRFQVAFQNEGPVVEERGARRALGQPPQGLGEGCQGGAIVRKPFRVGYLGELGDGVPQFPESLCGGCLLRPGGGAQQPSERTGLR